MEYLTQLLGESTDEISEFVENMRRYSRGEPLGYTQEDKELDRDKNTKDTQSSASIATGAPRVGAATLPTPKKSSKDAAVRNRRDQKQAKSRAPPPKIKITPKVAQSSIKSVKEEAPVQAKPVIMSRPGKGKATKVCGCYGTLHKALTNCLYCGRISCAEEGYDYCAFCGYMVEDVRDGNE